MEINYEAIGKRIRFFRKKNELTQQLLAEKSHLEPSNISHIERGATKLSLPSIVRIANALGVTVDDLLCDSLDVAFSPYNHMADNLLSDCTHQELQIITETICSLKENLRKVYY